MRNVRRGVLIGVLALTLALGSTSVFAMDNGNAGFTQSDLEGQGYTCTTIATGFIECTKPGSQTYWCDSSGQCQPAPFRSTQGANVRHVTSGGARLSQP
jgi:hypothetical protein